jgi:hypothetical protein
MGGRVRSYQLRVIGKRKNETDGTYGTYGTYGTDY